MTPLSLNTFGTWMQAKVTESLRLYRNWWKEISIGIFTRVVTLAGIIWAAIANPLFPDINDMNELITLGLFYMFQGLCPYNRPYYLTALGVTPQDSYTQNFLNYGPMNLILHLPCMIYPWFWNFTGGMMNFQPSFMVWHGFFDFLIFDRLMRMQHRSAALLVWMNPIMVTFNIVTHMSIPLFLLLMGYEKWNDPLQSMFWLGLGALTYQYIALILLFALVYHIRSYHKVILGLVPPLVVIGVFQVWAIFEGRPGALFEDLLLQQFLRSYEPWPLHTYSWYTWTGSIPAVIFNVYNILLNLMRPPSQWTHPSLWLDPLETVTGISLSRVMNTFALGLSVLLLIRLLWRPNYRHSILYSMIAMGVVLLSSPSGIWHHNFIIILPLFFTLSRTGAGYWYKTPPNGSPNTGNSGSPGPKNLNLRIKNST